jgi:hypothetical protein
MRVVKALGMVGAAVVVAGAAVVVALYVASERLIGRAYALPAEPIEVPDDRAAVTRGAHVALVRGCTECHGADLGGRVLIDDDKLGRFVPANLTTGAGGLPADYAPADWEHAVRHGVGSDGRPLLLMPSMEMHVIGDADLADLIAFARSVPPVDRELPESQMGPLGRVLTVFGQAPLLAAELIDHEDPHPPAPPRGVTVEYGRYLAIACTGCHHEDFAGGPLPGQRQHVAANLTPDDATGLGRWSEDEFVRALQTGVRPDGTQLSPAMPWRITAAMEDDELRAMWMFLRSLPPTRARTE